jgi:hypothetical protein
MTTIHTQPQYQSWLHQLRQSYDPKQLTPWDHLTHLRIHQPAYARIDQLNTFFRKKKDLLKRGQIVWGQTIQANQYLYHPGCDDAPAEVIFCPELSQTIDPDRLTPIAQKFQSLKGTQPEDPELAALAASITDEYDRHFGLPLPQCLSPDFPTETSVIYIVRKHLPNGYLSQKILPLLVYPEQPRVVMVLPCRYWPTAMEDWWID